MPNPTDAVSCRDCGDGWPIPRARPTNDGELVIEHIHRCGRRPAPGDNSPIPFGTNIGKENQDAPIS